MKLKTKLITLAVAFSATASFGSPLVTLSENSAIYFNGSAKVSHDSNIAFNDENELDDFIYEVTPGFEWVTGNPDTGAEFTLTAGYGIRRYADNDQFDTEIPSVIALGQFQTPKSTSSLEASYVESQTNSRLVAGTGELLETETTTLGAKTEYEISARTAIAAGLRYEDVQRVLGSDYTHFSVPVNVYYSMSEKVDAGIGYRYRTSSIDDSDIGDRDAHFVNFGLRGEFTEKLTGRPQNWFSKYRP